MCDAWCVMDVMCPPTGYWLLLTGCCGLRRFLFLFHSPLKLNKTPPWFVFVDGKSVIGRSHCRAERNDDPGTDRMKTERRGIFGRRGTCCILVAPHYYHHVLRRSLCVAADWCGVCPGLAATDWTRHIPWVSRIYDTMDTGHEYVIIMRLLLLRGPYS